MIDPVSPAAPSPMPCERLLIVEDDLDALESLGDMLAAEGVSVIHGATTVAEAEGLLARGFRPSAVVLDLLLGGDRGETFAHRLKADPAYSAVPVIALSGDHVALRQVGGVVERSFLKPARRVDLLSALREVCAA
jgi:DNA-binding response OmpR family regulator